MTFRSARDLEEADRRDPGLRQLRSTWAPPKGFARLKEINNTFIGMLYVLTGIFFFVVAGILAALIRAQLAVPENDLISADWYNQIFTMHGTTMMFLFAVPMMEAIAIFVIPQLLGARDLPFPRVSAYGYWAYLLGGLMVLTSLLFKVAPDGGWFMYVPLTGPEYSPGYGPDFWLLGIGFIEVAAIAASIELIIGILKFRPPGMSMDRMPIFAWYMLVFGFMILLGFPPLVLGDILLEVERAFDWPFYDADRGGDPLLWQHLFWLFGHPEVYIIFLPGAGVLSTVIPVFARAPLAGYVWVVLAAVGTGFLSFGLWVHHMYTTGIPVMSLSFFSAASLAVAIPSGIQVFAWIATIWSGPGVLFRAPMLYALGAIFIFVAGGLTGVMVALVPVDFQVHDTYFVVAHFHYVLFGGAVMPVFAALHYWTPLVTGRLMSETLGRWSFGLIFLGFNVAFFPMHLTGLRGMPRRVYTYPADLGWDWLNMISSIGAYMVAAGVAVFLWDWLYWHRKHGQVAGYNPWNAGTLEWHSVTPSTNFSMRSVPIVSSTYPLWDEPELGDRVDRGEFYLPDSPDERRKTLRTGSVMGEPRQVIFLPHPAWSPIIAAIGTATFFGLAIFKLWWLCAAAALVIIIAGIIWMWDAEPLPAPNRYDVGRGETLPVHINGADTHGFWAMALLLIFDAAAFVSLIFSALFLWTVNRDLSPPVPEAEPGWALAAAGLAVLASVFFRLGAFANRRGSMIGLVLGPLAGLPAMFASGGALMGSLFDAGISPTENAFSAVYWTFAGWTGFHIGVGTIFIFYTLARALAGKVTPERRQSVMNVELFWHFTTGLALVSLIMIHLWPRVI
ncbi:cytochrome c oxidase subunit I [Chelativorans sp. YIM 93263]|uniref:cytochrome c oxidase subunit I n=1 Tax=Chelativorans sp. YIM 93263 TaxID=2906648 RepID=UPI00237982AD|nr:cytochrome c oxidase subunit I [Chelativorans sp. YIM 93263]